MKNKKEKNGVACDVDDCIYNVDGCNCSASKIKVTKGKTQDSHFCKTYCNREK